MRHLAETIGDWGSKLLRHAMPQKEIDLGELHFDFPLARLLGESGTGEKGAERSGGLKVRSQMRFRKREPE